MTKQRKRPNTWRVVDDRTGVEMEVKDEAAARRFIKTVKGTRALAPGVGSGTDVVRTGPGERFLDRILRSLGK